MDSNVWHARTECESRGIMLLCFMARSRAGLQLCACAPNGGSTHGRRSCAVHRSAPQCPIHPRQSECDRRAQHSSMALARARAPQIGREGERAKRTNTESASLFGSRAQECVAPPRPWCVAIRVFGCERRRRRMLGMG
eukprot:5470639-Prymnesium_polylepis.1